MTSEILSNSNDKNNILGKPGKSTDRYVKIFLYSYYCKIFDLFPPNFRIFTLSSAISELYPAATLCVRFLKDLPIALSRNHRMMNFKL